MSTQPQTQTYLITSADTFLGYTLITQLSLLPHTFIISFTNTSSPTWTWRLLCTGKKEVSSHVQPLHLSSSFSASQAAEVITQKWGRRIDVVVDMPNSDLDARMLVSGLGGALDVRATVVVVRGQVEEWCGDFVRQMHERNEMVSLGVEIGEVKEEEMRVRAAWILSLVERVGKRKGSGSVVKWK